VADTVDTKTIFSGARKKVYMFINISDGTGETDVVKIDRSSLTGPNGAIPTYIIIEEVQWSIQGFASVRIEWDDGTDDEALVLAPGNGVASWVAVGGLKHPQAPGAAGEGDITFTTDGAQSGATYTITMVVRLKD
jgi:hypothetical protein